MTDLSGLEAGMAELKKRFSLITEDANKYGELVDHVVTCDGAQVTFKVVLDYHLMGNISHMYHVEARCSYCGWVRTWDHGVG